MAWSWSHTEEAYTNAFTNLAGLPVKELRVIYAEWHATDECEGFNLELYERVLKQAKGIAVDILVSDIWEKTEELRTCDNGGFNAWVCPDGCHTVSFDRDARLARKARQRGICD